MKAQGNFGSRIETICVLVDKKIDPCVIIAVGALFDVVL